MDRDRGRERRFVLGIFLSAPFVAMLPWTSRITTMIISAKAVKGAELVQVSESFGTGRHPTDVKTRCFSEPITIDLGWDIVALSKRASAIPSLPGYTIEKQLLFDSALLRESSLPSLLSARKPSSHLGVILRP